MGSLLDEELKPGSKRWTNLGYHGTQRAYWPPIASEGMDTRHSRGAGGNHREHHHFVREIEADMSREQAGVRFGSDVVVVVDLLQLHEAGAKIFRSCTDVILTSGLWGLIPPQFIVQIVERKKDATGRREVIYPSPSMAEAEYLRLFEAQEDVLDALTATMVAKARENQYDNIEEERVNTFLEDLERRSAKELKDTVARKRNRATKETDRVAHARTRLRMVYEFFGKKAEADAADAGIPFGAENADSEEDCFEEGETMWPAQRMALEYADREQDEVASESGASAADEGEADEDEADEDEEDPGAMSEAGESSSSLDVRVI